MLKRSACGALLLVLGLGSSALTQPATPSPGNNADAKRIGDLIGRLGSTKFQERSGAQKELEAIGAAALEQLKKSIASADLETSKRASELVRKIEERLFTAELLAPRRVRLQLAGVPVLEAVSELSKRSGYAIQVQGDHGKFANNKIALDTGDVTFWQALDKLCAEAGLMELTHAATPPVEFDELLRGNIQFLPVLPPPKGRPAPQLKPNIKLQNNLLQVQLQNRLVEIPPAVVQGPHHAIILVPGSPKNRQVSYTGSVRTRVHPLPTTKTGEYRLSLEAAAEPRLQGFTILGMPSVTKAIDDQGQNLLLESEVAQQNPLPVPAVARARVLLLRDMAVAGTPIQRQVTLRFKAGERPAKRLKELSGNFTAQVIAAPEALITLNNVLKAAGESAQGKSGGQLKLTGIDKLPNGDYEVRIHLENPPSPNPTGAMILGNGVIQVQQLQIQVGPFGGPSPPVNSHGLPELLDAKGTKFQVVQVPSRRTQAVNAAVSQEATIIYRGQNGHGEPDRLVVHGSRAVSVTVPFAFEGVGLE